MNTLYLTPGSKYPKSFSPRVINSTQQGNSNVAPLGEASQVPLDRMMIRRVFPNSSKFNNVFVNSKQWAQTPFRVALNAGDLLLRQSEPGGHNQVKGKVGIGAYRYSLGSIDGIKSGNGASGNQHYVYDSSVYTRYKVLKAKQYNYYDYTFGGSNNSAFSNIVGSKRFIRTM